MAVKIINRKMATKILDTGENVSEVFYVRGTFQVLFLGLPATGTNSTWYVEALPRQEPESSDDWIIVGPSSPFTNTPARQSLTVQGSPGLQYRVRNTATNPATNNGITAYVAMIQISTWG